MAAMRIYLDTSVFGGCFDAEFRKHTLAFMDNIYAGRAVALISSTVVAELEDAPKHVQAVLDTLLAGPAERLGMPREAEILRDKYVASGIVPRNSWADALHVAHATVARADVIVSWNFRHIVHPMRIRKFDGVNIANGYGPVVISTPGTIRWVLEEAQDE